jgi:hypothetical protein
MSERYNDKEEKEPSPDKWDIFLRNSSLPPEWIEK